MSSQQIMDGTVNPIIDYIKANVVTAVNEYNLTRPDSRVNITPFVDYLIYEKALDLRTPMLFVIGRNVEYLQNRGQNFIAAKVGVQISAVFQERGAELLTLAGWRYNNVLHKILDRAHIANSTNTVRNIVKVVSSEFGNAVQIKGQTDSPFRSEVMLTLEVEHLESEN
jgi:hypothetical protein